MRLVDVDKIIERLKFYCKDCNSYGGIRCRACDIGEAIDIIEDADEVEIEKM